MKRVQPLQSDLLYRNPAPHVHSRHAYFPSLILTSSGEMLASFAIGEAFEAVNLNTHIVRSADCGETWSESVPLALLAAAWVYDEGLAEDLTNHYTISRDGGRSWVQPLSTNLQGQTMAIMELPCGRILSIYRRTDIPGLWTNISRLEGDVWINESSSPLWGMREASLIDKNSHNIVHDFNELKFGAPCLVSLPDGTLFVALWCYEKLVSNIRWFKVIVS